MTRKTNTTVAMSSRIFKRITVYALNKGLSKEEALNALLTSHPDLQEEKLVEMTKEYLVDA